MSNTSATGGYLSPSSVNGNLEDVLFSEFLQPIVVGITGITASLVRPRWQQQPPNLPDYGVDWCAIGTTSRHPDAFAQTTHKNASDLVYRNQVLDLLASFYGPNSDANSDLLIMGFAISQNREVMQLAGYGFIDCDPPIITADPLNEQWTRRIDVGFHVRRAQLFTYPVLDLTGATVEIVNDAGNKDIVVLVEEDTGTGFGEIGAGISGFGA